MRSMLGETERDKIIHSSPCHADDFRFYFNRKPLKSFVWERKMVRFTVR